MASLQWEERVPAHNMIRYENAYSTGWYPPVVEDDDPRKWSQEEQDDLEAEWHFELGWGSTNLIDLRPDRPWQEQ